MKRSILQLPRAISVHVQKGESGALVAELGKYEAITEGDNLIELFFNVNDLIYAIFDVPKKLQNNIQFIPAREAQLEMQRIVSSPPRKVEKQFEMNRYIRDSSPKVITA